ncbi:MAG: non-heme iron oxygenase ferredoxin subunit [Burkholderiaceae bacterium]|nr:non-heme iron oxygenase ferredoxin subunit [Burkholderiaceae bacterium]MDO9090140.1 non-heme iron oxygenase ferredoxin subunit [Burkholderiaceae bacterium]
MAWQRCAAQADVSPGAVLPVQVGEESVALYSIDGVIYATSNVCTHEEAWLSEGYLDGDCIECPLHAAVYEVRTGRLRGGPMCPDLKTYPIRIEGSEVFIDLDAVKPPGSD